MARSYAELVALVADGGEGGRSAEAEVCREFAPRVRLYGLRHLRDEARAADLVQAVLMATIEAMRAGRVEEPAHLDRFVLGTSRNLVNRERGALSRAVLTADVDLGSVAPLAGTLEIAALIRCLGHLEDRARAVVYLSFQEELETSAIATALETSVANVRVLRHRAVAQLRTCLDGAA